MIDLETAAELDALAQRIARMRPPMSSNPHAFHEDRSELAGEIRAIATKLRTRQPPLLRAMAAANSATPRISRVVRTETRHIAGRTVQVLVRERLTEERRA